MNHSKLNNFFIAIVFLLVASPAAYGIDLLQSYRAALEQDARYLVAVSDANANREVLPQAFSQLLPNVSSSVSRNKNQTDALLPASNGSHVENSYSYFGSSLNVNLRQPLYRKYNFALFEQAKAQVASAEATLVKMRQDLINRLCSAYFENLMARDQLALVDAQKKALASQLQLAKRSFDNGQGTRTDIDDAQARLDMLLAQEFEAKNNLTHSRRQLESIINVPAGELAQLDPRRMNLSPLLPSSVDKLVEQAEEVNTELRIARANIEVAEKELEKAKSGHYPTLDLVASRGRDASANNYTINQRFLTSTVGAQMSIPIFGGGYVTSQERQASAAIEKVRYQYEFTRREVGLQVHKEYQNVTEGVLKIRALEQAERSADQAVYSNQKGFEAGTRTQVDILNAQQQRFNVRRDLAQERYKFILSQVRLHGLLDAVDQNVITAINNWLTFTN